MYTEWKCTLSLYPLTKSPFPVMCNCSLPDWVCKLSSLWVNLSVVSQVCSLLKRILPVIGPKNLAPIINVRILPPLGYSAIAEAVNSAATINQLGLLDCFLAIISKALSSRSRLRVDLQTFFIFLLVPVTSLHSLWPIW